jgi:tRNA U34 5-methylaminomethyl-2-thiouridine-forming methyltransferase MnmC
LRKLIQTSDGSHTFEIEGGKETYHSRHGAVREAEHVFIRAGLEAVASHRKVVNILEVGFGTGLNALLTLRYAREHHIDVNYTALEPFPIEMDEVHALNYGDLVNMADSFHHLHASAWDKRVEVDARMSLQKHRVPLLDYPMEHAIDLVYYDAFGPNTAPELWTVTCFSHIAERMREQALLTTYCAKGQVRRDLESVGFEVQRWPGPPGKREMLRAWKQAN